MNSNLNRLTKTIMLLLAFAFSSFILAGEALAKITPRSADQFSEPTSVYVIKRGDMLWMLAVKYFGSGFKWRTFEKYNDFTNPDLIYPGEKLRMPFVPGLPLEEAPAKPMVDEEAARKAKEAEAKMAELQKKLDESNAAIKKLQEALAAMKDQEGKLKELRDANEKLHTALMEKDKQISDLKKAIDDLSKKIDTAMAAPRAVPAPEIGKADLNKLYDELEEISAKLDNIEKALAKLSGQVEILAAQPREAKVEKVEKVEMVEMEEKPSKKAKLAVLFTTLVGTAVWFVANSVSSTK